MFMRMKVNRTLMLIALPSRFVAIMDSNGLSETLLAIKSMNLRLAAKSAMRPVCLTMAGLVIRVLM